MRRKRNPRRILLKWRNRQREAFTPDEMRELSKAERANIEMHLSSAKNTDAAVRAVHHSITAARMAKKSGTMKQADRLAAFESLADAASELHQFVDPVYQFKQNFGIDLGCADSFYTEVMMMNVRTLGHLQSDPLFEHRGLLSQLLEIIETRARHQADAIAPEKYIKNRPAHVLAHHLVEYARAGVLPMKPSASKEGRLARLFLDAAVIADIEVGDPEYFLKDK